MSRYVASCVVRDREVVMIGPSKLAPRRHASPVSTSAVRSEWQWRFEVDPTLHRLLTSGWLVILDGSPLSGVGHRRELRLVGETGRRKVRRPPAALRRPSLLPLV